MTKDITWECDNCKCTHTCTHVEHLRDDYLYKEDDPIRPIACPYFDDGDNSTLKRVTWKRVKTDEVNPSIGTLFSGISEPVVDADVDALLEVIKQKDAIIDNCRSSLRESYDRWLKQQGRLEYLEKQADPELYTKLTIAESKAKGREKEIARMQMHLDAPSHNVKLWLSDLTPIALFLVFVGGIIGWFAGLVLF
jgi:hypothetical protein